MPHNIKTGVIGFPISHSLSPLIHQHWYEVLNMDGHYEAIQVVPEELDVFFNHEKGKNLAGINVTVPHKQAVLKHIDHLDETAKQIGAVNTIAFRGDGLHGTNTDAYGFIENARQAVGDVKLCLEHVMILGAGGAARAAIIGLQEAGAKHITITNRTKDRAQALAKSIGADVEVVGWHEKELKLETLSMLVNTTSLGMDNMPALEIDLSALCKSAWVYDIVYAPLETNLLKQAKAQGNSVITGIGMLLYQAQKAFEYWHGVLPDIDEALMNKVMAVLASKQELR